MARLGFICCSFELHIWFTMKITEVALLFGVDSRMKKALLPVYHSLEPCFLLKRLDTAQTSHR